MNYKENLLLELIYKSHIKTYIEEHKSIKHSLNIEVQFPANTQKHLFLCSLPSKAQTQHCLVYYIFRFLIFSSLSATSYERQQALASKNVLNILVLPCFQLEILETVGMHGQCTTYMPAQ